MPDFGIFRGFGSKLFSDKLYAGQLPTQLGLIGSESFGFDIDSQAFFDRVTTAGGTLSVTEKIAIDTLVKQMKLDGIWTKMKAIYPYVGASAAACAQNLKSSSFTGTFNGGVTFSSNGITGNGSNAFMNTNFSQSANQSQNDLHISIYQRNILSDPSDVSIGLSTGSNLSRMYMNYSGSEYHSLASSGQSITSIETPQQGMFTLSRTSSSSFFKKQNNLAAETYTSTSVALISINYAVLSNNNNNTFQEFSLANIAFCSLGDGLSDAESSDLYTAVQAFQTTLGRQV